MSHVAKPFTQNVNEVNTEFLPFAKPCISEEAIQEVVGCIRSGWITTGPRVKAFEDQLKEYFQAPHVLTVSSGTAGLHIAIKALDLQEGDEVITTSMTFVATANMIAEAGAIPVFVDIEPDTYNIDPNLIEAAITPKTKAILPVHFAGYPVDLDTIYSLAQKYGLRVVEDAAHAIGTEYKGRRIGSFGDIQVFSFHPNKNMTTGEGGCVVTRDDALAKRIQTLRFHGIDREAWNRFSKQGSQLYDVVEPGYKYNMMDMQAALGIYQLKELDQFIRRRTELAQKYLEAFSQWSEIDIPQFEKYDHLHAWHLFNPLITSMDREEFMTRLKEKNIGTGLHFLPVHLFSYYQKHFGYRQGDLPVTEKVGTSIISLPLFPTLTNVEQNRVIDAMSEILRGKK